MRRAFTARQKRNLAMLSGGKCVLCGSILGRRFHADHIVPFSRGGETILLNGQALCAACNLRKSNIMLRLRPWQDKALAKAYKWLITDARDRHFLINAAPGAGKTKAACAIAKRLIDEGLIDRVVVIAPRAEVVRQWSKDFKEIAGRFMAKVTSKDDEFGIDLCATWAAIEGLQDGLQLVCEQQRVLLICDEHHHAAVQAAWGSSANSAFGSAKYVLVLTGTPIRSDARQTVWLAYDSNGAIDHPEDGTFTLSYGEAVDLGYCRPATFHRHEGKFSVDLEDGERIEVSSKSPAILSPELKRVPGLQRALEFYRLACAPQYEPNSKVPRKDGFQGTMIEWASSKLNDLRLRMANAGGLVIVPTIEMAEYMVELIEAIEGERPILVHSQLPNAENKIESFRHTDRRWIVSVAMISEGVDIPRLRVLFYLPNALTELSFRQAIGRVVRTTGPEDDTRAYVVMPSFETFETFARRIEAEMSASIRKDEGTVKTKRCPICATEAPLNAQDCVACGHQYPAPLVRFKACATCGHQNPLGATQCQNCGESFSTSFSLTLEEALRVGAIVRGADLNEEEVREGEALAKDLRRTILASGDEVLIKVLKQVPEELFGRLKRMINDSEL
jgi:superfamily II DNA or RNA helicase